ncbi:asparaginase domain-containing protein [Sphingobium chlorophenolicum]|uniref:L-asparaginase n=1 Tax=Sphingobium chlorophenolicum TaxID=46429 RepID=A0A081RJ73_SPHCR|nr:asparaginase domain-containing protein [Sphingobium chlorophenolicum]KEQ55246.1 L-asparaginase [Sphingobium chlorophenolicum]
MLSPETPILVLTTGGTIDKIYFDALSDYQVGETVMAKLLDIARVKRPFRIEEVTRKDSLELDDADRALIRDRVSAAPESHIIITHGTDTMTETAKLLSAIPGKTVVLVGALAPARFGESDASFNLGMAFATVQVAEPGVYITMSGSVFRADRVVKDRAKGAFVLVGD